MKAVPQFESRVVGPTLAGGQGIATTVGAASVLPGTVVAAKKTYYACRVCKCHSQIRTHCGVCRSRNCMELVEDLPPLPLAQSAGLGAVLAGGVAGAMVAGAAPTAAEVKTRGSLRQAIKEASKIVRRKSGIPKLDKVMGGGYVDKAAILIAGDPGAGKSTLLMQACIAFGGPVHPKRQKAGEPEFYRTLYLSGEEALEQVGARAARIPHAEEKGEWIDLVSTRSVPEVMGAILEYRPHLVVVDSVQEIGDEQLTGRFGGENQVANCIRSVMKCIRENGFGTAFFVCHVRKDGDIAGAKKAEHLVDMVCKLSIELREEEEDEDEDEDLAADETVVHDERYLEAYKNRYGSITERAVFTMTAEGLR